VSLCFSAYGLTLNSNSPVPGLVPGASPRRNAPNLNLYLGTMPSNLPAWLSPAPEVWHVSASQTPAGEPILQVWRLASGRGFRFRYSDATEFIVDARGDNVWATWPSAMTLEDTATYLLGPILGFVLRLRGGTCLHASAVVAGRKAFALVGSPGAGKSTTAAALAQRGLAVLSDDIVALEAAGWDFYVQPGYPRLNLWPDSVHALYGSPDRLPLVTPGWEKRFVDLTQPPYVFQRDPVALAAVYWLQEQDPTGTTVQIAAVPARAALMSLVANTYANYLLDSAMRAREFEFLGRLIARVPVRRVSFSHQPEGFAQLPEAIRADFEVLASGTR
jgi:hypothetical protein